LQSISAVSRLGQLHTRWSRGYRQYGPFLCASPRGQSPNFGYGAKQSDPGNRARLSCVQSNGGTEDDQGTYSRECPRSLGKVVGKYRQPHQRPPRNPTSMRNVRQTVHRRLIGWDGQVRTAQPGPECADLFTTRSTCNHPAGGRTQQKRGRRYQDASTKHGFASRLLSGDRTRSTTRRESSVTTISGRKPLITMDWPPQMRKKRAPSPSQPAQFQTGERHWCRPIHRLSQCDSTSAGTDRSRCKLLQRSRRPARWCEPDWPFFYPTAMAATGLQGCGEVNQILWPLAILISQRTVFHVSNLLRPMRPISAVAIWPVQE